MLFLFAFTFGKHTAAAMVHLLFTLATPLGMVSYGRRVGSPAVGVAGALLFFLSPIVGKTGTSAYIDVGLAGVLFALFYALEIWRLERSGRWLAPIGLLAGFAYAVKYSGAVAAPFALAFVVIELRRFEWRPLLTVALCALALMAPWMIKNAIAVGNPFSPFGNRYFPNPYLDPAAEKTWTNHIRTLNNVQWREIPLEVTVHGGRLQGVVGPVFLLAPLALLALRDPAGRRVIAAAVIFALSYYAAIATRYLIPCLPFLSLALAVALARWRAVLAAVVVAHALLSWPSVLRRYADRDIWRLGRVDWRAALRLRPEAEFLRKQMFDYEVGPLLEGNVPEGQPVFTFQTQQQAYHTRELITGWQSSLGSRLRDTLCVPFNSGLWPTWRSEYRFPETAARKIRLVQKGRSETGAWSITEVRVFRRDAELPRAPQWRLKASPNPWDVQLAFDNNPVTRWSSAQAYTPGMFVEIDFGRTESLDRVVVERGADPAGMRVGVEGEIASRRWQVLAEEAVVAEAPPPARLRRATTETVESHNIHWLLVEDSDPGARDFLLRQAQWGITAVAAAGRFRLYRLE
ncbi:MAG: glycosyltransferase family 39 protein [Acidobacteria bacterium]|nr:glycosyltransferase family 39 protein [Acidobacteriota bacterium]